MIFGERLKMVRGNWTRDEFSSLIEVHKNTIARWEKGEQFPDVQQIDRILALVPGVNPTWFVTGEGPMTREPGKERTGMVNEGASWEYSPVVTTNYDAELAEIVKLLKFDLPEAKPFVLKVLHGKLEMKEGLAGLGLNGVFKEEGKK